MRHHWILAAATYVAVAVALEYRRQQRLQTRQQWLDAAGGDDGN
jgi:hypothetical protein